MHPSKVITDPRINDTYYDPDLDKLYQYVKLGDILQNGLIQLHMKRMIFLLHSDTKAIVYQYFFKP